ncbi:hypothetical protein EMIHUDRAFT_223702 [Emiliania huxleyi CCMP1516]|uniref:GPI inositol-deacylase n=2 Tax=Emiliania huxleyi TaxID=2903 RepID=A0A0D3KTX4_EMIH1|nr:hypothetical protein EMIHUDRAFT_223702 [Emiliania huxleyi CCMP1516]EOD39209.1 hypothetical protein EMIHUDRAFT_223702 [Emiliania huxleyi CCMP1516]|eukprot:XP_005791638.1 hypothetical protein EMIHUDRAFT_223702 [Emiliania huxleyi CCMP1516]
MMPALGSPSDASSAMALEDSPVVIVPGFGNADIDYKTPLGQDADVGLESVLARRGFTDVRTMPCERVEWARVILGLLAAIVWRPWATPEGPAYSWFIDRLRGAVEEAHAQSGGKKVLLIAHSAGGWLSRAALSDGGAWRGGAAAPAELVSGLVTLGAPHFPPPEGTPDMTQGVIRAVNDDYPGAFLAREGIAYVTVGGDAIVGDDSKAQSPAAASVDNVYAMRGEGSAARVAFNSYLMTCGRGDVTGDGVVPLEWTLLEGARQVVLPGVLHSINEAGTTLPTDRWYGSEQVVDRWLGAVRQEVAAETTNPLEEAVSQMRRLVGLDAL